MRVGERVRRGQIIGYSGQTGWIAHLSPHLDFDVHKYFGKQTNNYKAIKITWGKKKRKK